MIRKKLRNSLCRLECVKWLKPVTGTGSRACPFVCMPKKPISVVVIEDGNERYILKTFADGSEERESVVKLPRKKRYPPRPYWHWDLNKGRKKGF